MTRGLLHLQVLILTLLILACDHQKTSTGNSSKSFSIVNGHSFEEPADRTLAIYTVLLRTTFVNPNNSSENITSNCTGVLVLDHFILTAAHCVFFERIVSAEVLFPLLGKRVPFNFNQVTVSSGYTGIDLNRNFENLQDIAFIRLQNTPAKPYQSLVLADFTLFLPHRFLFEALGYGQQHGILLKKLEKTLELKHITLEATDFDSKTPYFEVDQHQKGICFGDSGSPAIIRFENRTYLVGIATDILFNPTRIFEPDYDRCLEKSVYANILYFKSWIEKETQRPTEPGQ